MLKVSFGIFKQSAVFKEQRKERLWIRCEKDRARRRKKKYKKRSSETEDHEKQRLATHKRLKRIDENELERNKSGGVCR